MTEEELKIAEKLYYFTYPKGDWMGTQARIKKHWIDNTRQILSLFKQANYVQLDPDQSLPKVSHYTRWEDRELARAYGRSVKKAGFKKVR